MTEALMGLQLLMDELRRYATMLEARINQQQKEYQAFMEWNIDALEGLQARFHAIEQRLSTLEARW